MKKLIYVLIFVVLINSNSAQTSNIVEGGRCESTTWCLGGLHCINGYCKAEPGIRGNSCTFDTDCYGHLVCTLVNSDPRCSECRYGEHAGGDEYEQVYSLGGEGSADWPLDNSCLDGRTCSCDTHYNSGGIKQQFYSWSSQDDFGDRCWIDTECYDDMVCGTTQRYTSVRMCFNNERQNCISSSYCNPGYECSDNYLCVETPTVTTITIPTTTTTSTTTTTLPPIINQEFNCMVLANISQSIDDGYELLGPTLVPFHADLNGDLRTTGDILFGNKTAAEGDTGVIDYFTFRKVLLPPGANNIVATIFVKLKNYTSAEQERVWFPSYQPTELNLPNFDNVTYKPSKFDSTYDKEGAGLFNGYYIILNPFTSTLQGAYPQGDGPDAEGNDETSITENPTINQWYGFRVNLNATLGVLNRGLLKNQSNITVFVGNDMNFQEDNYVYYSYDTDPTSAARLCINYTANGFANCINQCSTDDDCPSDLFCQTGHTCDKVCVPKMPSYIEWPDGTCYKDHECLTGKCSATTNTYKSDYPEYNGYPPYEIFGKCLPTYDITIKTQPEILAKGDTFNVYANVKYNGVLQRMDACKIRFDFIDQTYFFARPTAWAYTTSNNTAIYEYDMFYEGVTPWDYNLIDTVTVNNTLLDNNYKIYMVCDKDGTTITKTIGVSVVPANSTNYEFTIKPPTDVMINKDYTARLYFTNYTNKRLSNADCYFEYYGQNKTMIEDTITKTYSITFAFNSTGTVPARYMCFLDGYNSFQTPAYGYRVMQPHCNNGVKDSTEFGVDCGGECIPCDEKYENLIDDGEKCTTDSQCKNNYCNPNGLCSYPTCSDNIQNQGESQVDCGGMNCPQCGVCFSDNDCSLDGSAICDRTTYECTVQDCTTDADCSFYESCYINMGTCLIYETFCDTNDGFCKLEKDDTTNGTIQTLGMDIIPDSHLSVNQSGTIFAVFNCDDKNNGFTVNTKQPTAVTYSFATSNYAPALVSNMIPRTFGAAATTKKNQLITELCDSNQQGYGGLSIYDSRYAAINFKACAGVDCTTKVVDVITFRNNLENDFNIQMNYTATGEKQYLMNATNRSIQVWVKDFQSNSWINVTTDHMPQIVMNYSTLQDEKTLIDSFFYRVNSSYGEIYESRYGQPFYMPVEWDKEKNWFKLNLPISEWMIWVALAGIIVALVYMNYRSRNRREGQGVV